MKNLMEVIDRCIIIERIENPVAEAKRLQEKVGGEIVEVFHHCTCGACDPTTETVLLFETEELCNKAEKKLNI